MSGEPETQRPRFRHRIPRGGWVKILPRRLTRTSRSRFPAPGATPPPDASAAELTALTRRVKELRPDVFTVIDNCYGEFVCETSRRQTLSSAR